METDRVHGANLHLQKKTPAGTTQGPGSSGDDRPGTQAQDPGPSSAGSSGRRGRWSGGAEARRARSDWLARHLALAHWIERAVEEGRAGSYGGVARALGLTESRITQVTALLGLPPAVQEAVLLGEGGVWIREAIRKGREVEWGRQGSGS